MATALHSLSIDMPVVFSKGENTVVCALFLYLITRVGSIYYFSFFSSYYFLLKYKW